MIPSDAGVGGEGEAVYQRGWMIDSQLHSHDACDLTSISKGMDD